MTTTEIHTTSRRWRLAVAAALLMGWALRLIFWQQQSSAGVVLPAGDPEEYYRGAIHIYKDLSYYDNSQWIRAPLPSIFLALCFALIGSVNLPIALAIQALVCGLVVLPVAATARSYFKSDRAGIVAAFLAATYLPHAISASWLMSEGLAVLTIALCIWGLQRWRAGGGVHWIFIGGLGLGLFTLARAIGLYAQVIVFLWIIWRYQRTRSMGIAVGAFLLGFWVIVGPWSVRTSLAVGHLVLVDTNAGFSLWSGTPEPGDRVAMQAAWNRDIPNPADRQSAQMDRAIENIKREPGKWLGTTANKLVTLWQLRSRALIANSLPTLAPVDRSAPLTLLGDLQYLIILLAAIAAVVLATHWPAHWFLLLWPIYGSAMSAVSLGHPRLRIALEVPLLVLAAYPLAHPRRIWREFRTTHRWKSVVTPIALVAALLLTFSTTYVHFIASQIQLALGDPQAAIAAQPGTALPLLALAEQQLEAGDTEAARTTLGQAVALDEHILIAHALLLEQDLRTANIDRAEPRLAAIQGIGRDNNELYSWLWERRPAAPRPDLDIGTAPLDLGLLHGFGQAFEEDGRTFRWTQGRAEILLPEGPVRIGEGRPDSLHIALRGWREQTVQVLIDGEEKGTCRVGTEWSDCQVLLPYSDDPRTVTILSEPDVPWPPEDYLVRGVAVDRVTVHP